MAGKLFYFNPTCEMAVANGQPFYTPPKHLEKFRNDLAVLPIYFGDGRDVVLIDGDVPLLFLESLRKLGWDVPLVVNCSEDIPSGFLPLKSISPWGWSPSVISRLNAFATFLENQSLPHTMLSWSDEYKIMMSRITGQHLSQLMKDALPSDGYISIPEVPVRVEQMSQLIEMERVMLSPIFLKTPWSASGRGLFKIRTREENVAENNWIKSKFKQQGFLMAEPFLNKIQDLSFHFKKENNQLEFLGVTFFKSESDGRFMGCYTHTPKMDIGSEFPLNQVLEKASTALEKSLNNLDVIAHYNGYIGVDALLFHDALGEVKLHPCIEVNLRYTMGLLNLFLRNKVHPTSKGFWNIIAVDKADVSAFTDEDEIVIKDGLLLSGRMALTPPPSESGFMVVLAVTNLSL